MKTQAKKESWDRIFDLSPYESEWMHRGTIHLILINGDVTRTV